MVDIVSTFRKMSTKPDQALKALKLKSEIDKRCPGGTSESEVLDFLRKEHPGFITWPSGARTEYGVSGAGAEPRLVLWIVHRVRQLAL
jgi:hypothetical protein